MTRDIVYTCNGQWGVSAPKSTDPVPFPFDHYPFHIDVISPEPECPVWDQGEFENEVSRDDL
jgi:hypothetical protein